MKFSGEIKFPELDHPGVPIHFIIDGRQAELTVDGESLGRWSLYDVQARRLVASAFQIDLAGSEVTFVADDPIDFAYRGVEHMAETWAQMKAMQVGRRMVAVRKSRKDTLPSRLDELRAAMEENLEVQTRPLAGEGVMPSTEEIAAVTAPVEADARAPSTIEEEVAIPPVGPPPPPAVEVEPAALAEERSLLDVERRRVAEERARLEEERSAAEQREAVRLEAYRLEMQRLEEEREELRRQLAALAEQTATTVPSLEESPDEAPAEVLEEEPVPEELPVAEEEPEEEPVAEEEPEEEPVAEEELEEEPVAVDGALVDLSGFEIPTPVEPEPEPEPAAAPFRQPAMAGAGREQRGLMGAVRAAFARGGTREHEHQFIVAPGGIGIVRYVCEICGYVSISVND